MFANLSMSRVIRFGNYGVYVCDERGVQHHWPHAHIKHRGVRIASVYLISLAVYDDVERVPKQLAELINKHHLDLLAEWERLNP